MSHITMERGPTYIITSGLKGWEVIERVSGRNDKHLYFTNKIDLIGWLR